MDYDTKMRMIKQWFADFHSFAENYGDNYYDPLNDDDDKVHITRFDVLYEQINESEAHDCDPRYFKYGTFIRNMKRDDEIGGADVSILTFNDDNQIVIVSVDDFRRAFDDDGADIMPYWVNHFYVKHNEF